MTFKYTDVNLMDFDRFDELHDIGYNRTIQLMDSIKMRISRRVNYRQLERERIAYKNRMPELIKGTVQEAKALGIETVQEPKVPA